VSSLVLYTIYERPSDYPEGFVVTMWIVGPDLLRPSAKGFATDLEHARRLVPRGLYRMPREPGDDPCIVENWI